jgi:hypothetical protein
MEVVKPFEGRKMPLLSETILPYFCKNKNLLPCATGGGKYYVSFL